MSCTDCGGSIPADGQFCPYCGSEVIDESVKLTVDTSALPVDDADDMLAETSSFWEALGPALGSLPPFDADGLTVEFVVKVVPVG